MNLPRTLTYARLQVYPQPEAVAEVECQSSLAVNLCRPALPIIRRPPLILYPELHEVEVDVVLSEVAVLAHLLHEALDVHRVVLLGALAFPLELGLPACLLFVNRRVGSLGRLGSLVLQRRLSFQLQRRLGAGNDWFDGGAGVDLDCRLGGSAHQDVFDSSNHLLEALEFCPVNVPLPFGLLDKVSERGVPHVVATLLHVVIVEPTVLLGLDVPVR